MSSCTCGIDTTKNKLEILQKKYSALKKNHRKLVEIAIELTCALEGSIKGVENADTTKILARCLEMYPGLFKRDHASSPIDVAPPVMDACKPEEQETNSTEEINNISNTAVIPEEDKEYYEGFWSRPRIPRTPQP